MLPPNLPTRPSEQTQSSAHHPLAGTPTTSNRIHIQLNPPSNNLKNIVFREALDHERVEFHRVMERGFSGHYTAVPGHLEFDKAGHGPMSDAVCAFDGDEMVGTSCWEDFELTVPGGKTDFMGVTAITVSPTHTRRGILREMMRRLLKKGRDAGKHTAGLWASESHIYGRFGFGISGGGNIAKIDTRDARFRITPPVTGEVRFADRSKMRTVAPAIWKKTAAVTPGMMIPPDVQWDWIFSQERINRMRDGKPFYVTYTEDGEPLGYAIYRIEFREENMHSKNVVKVDDLIAATPSAEAALWRYVLDIDLATEVVHQHHPLKSNLLWLLADPRKLSLTPYDSVWIRILDPIKSLTSRTYSAPGEVVIEVTDDFCPWTQGTYQLAVDDTGAATCAKTTMSPDVTMPIASLGSIFMGVYPLSDLARATRVTERKSGSIALIDTMFPTSGVHSFLPDF